METVNLKAIEGGWRMFSKASGLGGGIHTEQDYKHALDLVEQMMNCTRSKPEREQAGHPFNQIMAYLSPMIEAYEEQHYAMPRLSPVEYLKRLMAENNLRQSDLPEIGNQSVVSQILNGNRSLNIKQVRSLATRFGVPADAFI